MEPTPLVQHLLGLSDELVQLAETAIAAKTAAEAALAKHQEADVLLQKVASDKVTIALDALAEASLLPAASREKIASMLSTHDGALEVLQGVVYLAVAPPDGGTPVSPTMSKQAAKEEPVSRVSRRKVSDADLADWTSLIRTGF